MKKVDIIIPIYNEENNIPRIHERIQQVFSELTDYEHRILFVNDGSSDQSQEILTSLAQEYKPVKYIEFSRNFGHQVALIAGITHSDPAAQAVITMDGDLQHPPEIIPELIKKWEEGYEVVYTLREYGASTSYLKKKTSDLYYRMLEKLTDFKFEKGEGGDFKLYDARVITEIKENRESDLFLRGYIKWLGFRQTGISYEAGIRENGTSRYTITKMLRLAISGITSFSIKPLFFAAYLGFFFSLMSLAYVPYVAYALITDTEVSGWASLIVTIVFFGGLQLSILGIMGIYLGKVFMQTQRRSPYIIKSKNLK